MTTLKAYSEVTQLNEDVEYPSGYNCIEIIGTGDEKTVQVFPSISLTGPFAMSSDGVTVATLTVEITDTNSADPFYLEPNQFEEVTPDSPQEITTSYWITALHGVYEDIGKTKPIPSTYLEFSENRIHIKDGWKASNAPDGWQGFYSQQAFVEYDGQYTISVEDGLQTADRWWIRSGDDETRTEADVSGLIYIDSLATTECTSSEIGIPSARGQTTTVRFYYRPDAGEAGIAYLNAEWGGVPASWPISVTSGSWAGSTVRLTPDPGSIKPGESSIITAEVTDRDGAPINGADLTFYIQAGKGNLLNAKSTLKKVSGQIEETESSSTTEFSLDHPIMRVTAIEVIGGGFTWNGLVTISGTSVTLQNQTFSNAVVPLRVTYDWGGQATTEYQSSLTGDKDGDTVYIGAKLGNGPNGLCSISINESSTTGDGDINISASPSSIDQGAESEVICTCRNSAGNTVTSPISFTLLPNKGNLTMGKVSTPIVDEAGSITDMRTVSVEFDVDTVQSIEFNGHTFTVESIDGNEILVKSDFGVTTGTALVSYTPKGYLKGTYTAEMEDYDVYITAMYSDETGPVYDSVKITVGSGDDNEGGDSLTLTAPSTQVAGTQAQVQATLTRGGNPLSGESIAFATASGVGNISASATTDSEGIAKVTATSSSAGSQKINATFGELTASASITWTAPEDPENPGGEKNITLPPVIITGWADPTDKTYELSNGATIKDWGLAEGADSFGCIDNIDANDGYENYLKIYNTNNEALAWDIQSVMVSGGIFQPDSMQKMDPFYLDALEIGVPWTYAANTAREQICRVVDKADETVPIVGATVKMGGQTRTTDQNGVAKFSGLSPGVYQIAITHPNYKDNRAGVVGGTGIYDSDTTNDSFTVTDYSSRKWILSKMQINISITYVVTWRQFYLGYDQGDYL